MSFNFTVHQINRSFEQLGQWYQEFLGRSETAFRNLHERVSSLEQQQQAAHGPTDEQLERVLHKILADRFGDTPGQPAGASQEVHYFVQPPYNGPPIPKQVIDPNRLVVDPTSVPSRAYGETFRMLQQDLRHYPRVEDANPQGSTSQGSTSQGSASRGTTSQGTTSQDTASQDTTSQDDDGFRRPEIPENHRRPW